jgi:hypothetical protein
MKIRPALIRSADAGKRSTSEASFFQAPSTKQAQSHGFIPRPIFIFFVPQYPQIAPS